MSVVDHDDLREAVDHYESCLTRGFGADTALQRARNFLIKQARVTEATATRALAKGIRERREARAQAAAQ